MKFKALALLTVGLVALTSCASPSEAPASPAATSAAAVVEKRMPTVTPTPKVTAAQIGAVATHGGIQIQVTSAVASPTVSTNTSGYRVGTGWESYEDVPAQAGGRYIVVNAVVTNNAKAPIDLTCGYPIRMEVFNTSSQVYSPIQDLSQIKDNPECNAQLQPGFESPMTWAFLVPAKSTILGAAFSEVDYASTCKLDPTIISFGAGL